MGGMIGFSLIESSKIFENNQLQLGTLSFLSLELSYFGVKSYGWIPGNLTKKTAICIAAFKYARFPVGFGS